MELNTTIARQIISLFPQFAFMTYQSHSEDVNVPKVKTQIHPTVRAVLNTPIGHVCVWAVTGVHAQKLSPELNLNFDLD